MLFSMEKRKETERTDSRLVMKRSRKEKRKIIFQSILLLNMLNKTIDDKCAHQNKNVI